MFTDSGATTSRSQIPGHVVLVANPGWFSDEFVGALSGAARSFSSVAPAEALERIAAEEPDVLLVPEQLDGSSGFEFLQAMSTAGHQGGAVMVLAEDGLERGAEALSHGAVDFLVQPLGLDQVVATLTLVARSRGLAAENARLNRMLHGLRNGDAFVGCSPAARRLAGVLARVAESSATVLIEGREGSGKTLAAKIIHASSRRSEKPLVLEYSETLTLERLDAELENTHGGVLLLEDVEKLPADAQSRMVRFIKEKSTRPQPSEGDVRILTTTTANLPELVARGKFREDLYYRLNVFPIVVPSLQERRDDVAVLAAHFLELAGEQSKTRTAGFTTAAMILMETHPWPGNVAQLQDSVFRAHAIAKDSPIDRQHLLGPTTGLTADPVPVMTEPARPVTDSDDEEVREEDILALETEEKRLLARALKATKGNVRRAAQLLRIGRATLYRKIQVYKLRLN